MALIEKFIPKIPLPSFFRLESKSSQQTTRLKVQWNLDGNPGERVQEVEGSTATLLEVVESFPGVGDKVPGMVRNFAGNIPLPPNWVLECGPASEDKEGFLLTFDVGSKHWEKHLEVKTIQLNQLSDLIGWVAEANKIDRHRAK